MNDKNAAPETPSGSPPPGQPLKPGGQLGSVPASYGAPGGLDDASEDPSETADRA